MSEAGRPSKFTPEIADAICNRLADGETLIAICRDEDMPGESTVRGWVLEDRGGFSAKYAQARLVGYERMADELLDISDDARNDWMERRGEDDAGWAANGEHMNRSRLRVDTRKWLLSKALPKVYGDKVQVGGDPDNPLKVDAGAVLDKLIAAMAEKKAGEE